MGERSHCASRASFSHKRGRVKGADSLSLSLFLLPLSIHVTQSEVLSLPFSTLFFSSRPSIRDLQLICSVRVLPFSLSLSLSLTSSVVLPCTRAHKQMQLLRLEGVFSLAVPVHLRSRVGSPKKRPFGSAVRSLSFSLSLALCARMPECLFPHIIFFFLFFSISLSLSLVLCVCVRVEGSTRPATRLIDTDTHPHTNTPVACGFSVFFLGVLSRPLTLCCAQRQAVRTG